MRHLKTFENKNDIEFFVGDIVICIDEETGEDGSPKKGKVYEVLKIYNDDVFKKDFVTERELYEFYINARDLETNKIIIGWFAYRYQLLLKSDTQKYNI